MSESKPKIGEGHAEAMFRQGLRELRGALYPESNVAQPSEYGIYGTRTPGEVAEDRRGDRPNDQDMDEERVMDERDTERSPSIAERVEAAKERSEQEPSEGPELDRD